MKRNPTVADPIPVLTLWQPWASLVAIGAKTIETRGWATPYRGPIAIHAAAKRPNSHTLVGDYRTKGFGRTGLVLLGPGLPEFQSTPRLQGYQLSLGKILATATLVDCVPMIDNCGIDMEAPAHICRAGGGISLLSHRPASDPFDDGETEHDVTDQMPLGDFTPGRFGWLLTDIVNLDEPVPFKGGQRLTRTWEPT